MREKIWVDYLDSKFKLFYMDLLIAKYKKYELAINIFLGFVTSSSIAAWGIWKELPLLWATLIGISHIVQLIKPNFPLAKYRKELSKKVILGNDLILEYEKAFYEISKNKHSDDYVAKEYFRLKNKRNKIFTLSDELILDKKSKIIANAEVLTQDFLRNQYNYN